MIMMFLSSFDSYRTPSSVCSTNMLWSSCTDNCNNSLGNYWCFLWQSIYTFTHPFAIGDFKTCGCCRIHLKRDFFGTLCHLGIKFTPEIIWPKLGDSFFSFVSFATPNLPASLIWLSIFFFRKLAQCLSCTEIIPGACIKNVHWTFYS